MCVWEKIERVRGGGVETKASYLLLPLASCPVCSGVLRCCSESLEVYLPQPCPLECDWPFRRLGVPPMCNE